jgi:hypothetical protein
MARTIPADGLPLLSERNFKMSKRKAPSGKSRKRARVKQGTPVKGPKSKSGRPDLPPKRRRPGKPKPGPKKK